MVLGKSWSKKSKSTNRKEGNIQDQDVQGIWQCGKLYFEDYKNTIRMLFRLFLFIERWTLCI
jgi:UDP-N-acetylglucosamine--N-acetylmuramyl-(pentapeptide) pyrophosphoryl-undecaprenol N-acetylglucosamine transferase